ncbi:DNA mismatch repair protein MutT [Bacillus wiedmannii]|uniref:NUDIX hydrolase n=1 Tax=Bacillus wiedmannii TaxID=1890302 RepID=UPI000BF7B4CC|nr:NUDIX hydrolase [Bacillus wiedmannii]PFX48841.1 DNA mismatch repair protein MutT [Bacillus wiedmannii]PHF24291.1 DNA mismatch repair protein MutT [Bacillus wiedmannii]
MQTTKNYHQAFGVYGICVQDGKLLVINKNGGPYINRFDLPGGSLEEGEPLVEALKREFQEETGFEIEVTKHLGITDFILPWNWKEFNHVHHVTAYYLVQKVGGCLITPTQFEGQDSLGALWISPDKLTIENASPLVLKAVEWLQTNTFDFNVQRYSEWDCKKID